MGIIGKVMKFAIHFKGGKMERYVIKNEFRADASDLALERRRADVDLPGVEYRRERADIGSWERIKIRSEEGARSIGRPMGVYDTLTLPRMCDLDCDEIDDAKNEVAKGLCRICDASEIAPDRILVVGLGNPSLTPDAVGALSADRVAPTMHIKREDEHLFYSLECSEIAVITPGVSGKSGLEAAETVRCICERIKPDVVFAIDALAAGAPSRLGTTVQICNTGIQPGAGIGNGRLEISEGTLGVPVIAIGVPTVINSQLFIVENGEARAPRRSEGMFLCPQYIGEIVANAAKIIGGGINQAFGLDLYA